MTIAIEFDSLQYEPSGRSHRFEILLGIQASLRIEIDERLWFSEPAFPVVELAKAVNTWLRRGGDLNFTTMEAAESPFLWVLEREGGCVLGEAWQKFPVERILPCSALRATFAKFASDVVAASRGLGLDVDEIIQGEAG